MPQLLFHIAFLSRRISQSLLIQDISGVTTVAKIFLLNNSIGISAEK
jgi:hypothetical protein